MTTTTTHDRAPRRVHPLNTVAGLGFLAVVGLWLAADQDVLEGREVGRAVAIGLIALGVLGFAATLLVGRRSRGRQPHAPVAADLPREDESSVAPRTDTRADDDLADPTPTWRAPSTDDAPTAVLPATTTNQEDDDDPTDPQR